MNGIVLRSAAAAVALVVVSGCDGLNLGPPDAASSVAVEPAAVPAIPDLQPYAGELYSSFATAEGGRYSPDALGLNAADRVRFWRAMAVPTAGQLITGGGAEALVFRGCAEPSCDEGAAVIAIDTATGTAFAAVRDAGGAEILAPNERVEALLRLNSPTGRWDQPAPTQTAASETARP